MGEKSSINCIITHEKIRNLIFEEWEKMSLLLEQGPEMLQQFFCKLWNEAKQELEYVDDIDIMDLDMQIKPKDFTITYSVLKNKMKAFNFIMPKPITSCGQVECLTLVITKNIPKLFTLELENNKNSYLIGEWQIDFENNRYIYLKHETINNSNVGEFLGKIDNLLIED